MSLNIAVNPCWFACNNKQDTKKPRKRGEIMEKIFCPTSYSFVEKWIIEIMKH